MPRPSVISTLLRPRWAALTREQRIAWQFFTMHRPITSAKGDLYGLYGYQGFVQTNAILATIDDNLIMDDPPTSDDRPRPLDVSPQALPRQSRASNGDTLPAGFAWLVLNSPVPLDHAATVRQAVYGRSKSSRRPWSTRHVTVIPPGATGTVNLQVPSGWFPITEGGTKYGAITGKAILRRRVYRLARLTVVHTESGRWIEQFVHNPLPPK